MKRLLSASTLLLVGVVLLIRAFPEPPQPLDWLTAWLGLACGWVAALLAVLALPERLRRRLSPGQARLGAAVFLLVLNPFTGGLVLGGLSWQQAAWLDDALDKTTQRAPSVVTALHERQHNAGGAQHRVYEVTYAWQVDGQRLVASTTVGLEEFSSLRQGQPFRPLRYLKQHPGLHRVGEERRLTWTLRAFTWAMGILTGLGLLILVVVIFSREQATPR